jgi:exodeoxyribonuclease V gamma subunit
MAQIAATGDAPQARREAALSQLEVLIDLYDRGMREPLPLACEASAAYAQAAAVAKDAEKAALGGWETTWGHPKEDRQPEHLLVYGDAISLRALLDEAPRADEWGDGWDQAQPTRFGRYARRLWDGLLSREELSDR